MQRPRVMADRDNPGTGTDICLMGYTVLNELSLVVGDRSNVPGPPNSCVYVCNLSEGPIDG